MGGYVCVLCVLERREGRGAMRVGNVMFVYDVMRGKIGMSRHVLHPLDTLESLLYDEHGARSSIHRNVWQSRGYIIQDLVV